MAKFLIGFYGLSRANINCWNNISTNFIDQILDKYPDSLIVSHNWLSPAGEASTQVSESASLKKSMSFVNYVSNKYKANCVSMILEKQFVHNPSVIKSVWGNVNRSNAINAHISINKVLLNFSIHEDIDGIFFIRNDINFHKKINLTDFDGNKFYHSGLNVGGKYEAEDLFFYIPAKSIRSYLLILKKVADNYYFENSIYNVLIHTAKELNINVSNFSLGYNKGVCIWRPGLKNYLRRLKNRLSFYYD